MFWAAIEAARNEDFRKADALALKPKKCSSVITSCAVVYESADCASGWKLPINEVPVDSFKPTINSAVCPLQEERRFRFWSSNCKYRFCCSFLAAQKLTTVEAGPQNNPRSDIDVVAIRANCKFVGFIGSNYNDAQMTVNEENYDRSCYDLTFSSVYICLFLHMFIVCTHRWIVLADSPEYRYMDERIKSLNCSCVKPKPVVRTTTRRTTTRRPTTRRPTTRRPTTEDPQPEF